MNAGEVMTIVVGCIEAMLFMGAIIYAVVRYGKKEQIKVDDSSDLREKYDQCCADIGAIRSEIRITAKGFDAAMDALTEKVTTKLVSHGEKIAWLEAKINGRVDKG